MHQIDYIAHPEISIIEDYFGLRRHTPVAVPFFYNVTLRDGNQALKRPWGLETKKRVFALNCELGVQGIELGYPYSSKLDFESFCTIAETAPEGIVIGGLARADERDIQSCATALKHCPRGVIPRLHTFLGMSPFHMKYALRKDRATIVRMAISAVTLARELMGEYGQVQFSPEHFGDCISNIDWLIEALNVIIEAGRVDVINLPNTVERYRPDVYAYMVRRIVDATPACVTIAVHPHNDLDMGTASAVAGYFAGANQIEVTDNGLGERPGNSKLHSVAVALFANGVPIDLNMEKLYPTALEMAELSGVPIHEKEPLIGSDVRAQRSGIHQSGTLRTTDQQKGAYRPIDWPLIGRPGDDEIHFTSQSGYSGAMKVLSEGGRVVDETTAKLLMPGLTAAAEIYGTLDPEECAAVHDARRLLASRKNTVTEEDVKHMAIQVLDGFRESNVWILQVANYHPVAENRAVGYVQMSRNGVVCEMSAIGDGSVDALFAAIRIATGEYPDLVDYEINPVSPGTDAQGTALISLSKKGRRATSEWSHTDIVKASAHAFVSALNKILSEESAANAPLATE